MHVACTYLRHHKYRYQGGTSRATRTTQGTPHVGDSGTPLNSDADLLLEHDSTQLELLPRTSHE